MDRVRDVARLALSGRRSAHTFRRTNARCVARCARLGERNDQRRHSAPRRRGQQLPVRTHRRRDLPIDKRAAAASHNIAPEYFKTWGIPLLAGRDFDEHDTPDRQNVIIISQGGAKKVFGNEDPLGKTLLIGSASIPSQIVGVVGDVRSRKVAEPDDVELYRPWAQDNFNFLSIDVRSGLSVEAVTKLVRGALAKVDPGLAIALPQSMDAIVAQAARRG